MLFAILFSDNPEADASIRAAHMADHLDFLDAHSDAVHAAGPLSDASGVTGGLWIVDVPDRAAADALVKADPFWPTGLRKSYEILGWRQVYADGARRIT